MSTPNDSPYRLAMRVAAGFLFAALATYIPFAAFGLYIALDLKMNPPPPPALGGIGVALCFIVVGPLCSVVAGIVGACLAGYRKTDLRRMVLGILVAATLVIAAMLVTVFGRVLEFL